MNKIDKTNCNGLFKTTIIIVIYIYIYFPPDFETAHLVPLGTRFAA